MESENTTKSQSVIETENIIFDSEAFSKMTKLQSLIKKESSLRELCKIFYITKYFSCKN
jgi:hypothetical protein